VPTLDEVPSTSGFLVVGAGRFGSRAINELKRRYPHQRLLAIDRNPRPLEPWRDRNVEVHVGESVEILDLLLAEKAPLWLIPAVPTHLALDWVMRRLSPHHMVTRIPVPDRLIVPNPHRGPHGDLHCSYATFLCPEDCVEPKDKCTVTGERREQPLFQLLGRLKVPGFRVFGLRSRQLAPGVGGYLTWDLQALSEAIGGTGGDVLIYTACRCHGVLSGLRVGPKNH
jgi:hypothetical protein